MVENTLSVCENFRCLPHLKLFDLIWRFFWFFDLVFELQVKRPLFLLWDNDFVLKNFYWPDIYSFATRGIVPLYNIKSAQFMSNFSLRDLFFQLWLKIRNVFVALCSLMKSHKDLLNFHQWGASYTLKFTLIYRLKYLKLTMQIWEQLRMLFLLSRGPFSMRHVQITWKLDKFHPVCTKQDD